MIDLTLGEIFQGIVLVLACAGVFSIGFLIFVAIWTWRAEKKGFYKYD